jgi:phosphoglycolate phosphatase
MSYAAVLFDLDGTLLDTLGDLADSMNAALERLGYPPHPPAAYCYFVGEGVEILAFRALPEAHRAPTDVARCVGVMAEEYATRCLVRTRPYPGIPALLDALAARGIKTAVLSNKPDRFTQELVAKALASWRFAAVRGALPGAPVKPDPTAARELAEKLAVPPGEFLYLGDTGVDMQTAVAAGMYPVGVRWGFRPAEELLAGGARTLLARPEELLGLL